MKKLLVFGVSLALFLVLSLSLVSSQNISVNYPHEINCKEEFDFEVELKNFSQDVYDVKIDITAEGKRIAKIFDAEWKSTYYYVNNIINTEEKSREKFLLKIVEDYKGNAKIEIKIKDSKEKTKVFSNYEIDVKCEEEINETKKSEEEIISEEEIEKIEEKETEKEEEEEIQKPQELKILDGSQNSERIQRLEQVGKEEKIINLGGKDIKTKQVYKSKTQYIKEYAIYGFALFCVFVIIILIIKKRI